MLLTTAIDHATDTNLSCYQLLMYRQVLLSCMQFLMATLYSRYKYICVLLYNDPHKSFKISLHNYKENAYNDLYHFNIVINFECALVA